MKKFSITFILGIIACILTGCSSEEYELYKNPTYLPSPDKVTDCSDSLNDKKGALDNYIFCMSAVNHLNINNDNDVMEVAKIISDCAKKIDDYNLKSSDNCLPSQAKLISMLDGLVIDFMNCTTEARFEESYIANYLFCHADMMKGYNNEFFSARQNYIK